MQYVLSYILFFNIPAIYLSLLYWSPPIIKSLPYQQWPTATDLKWPLLTKQWWYFSCAGWRLSTLGSANAIIFWFLDNSPATYSSSQLLHVFSFLGLSKNRKYLKISLPAPFTFYLPLPSLNEPLPPTVYENVPSKHHHWRPQSSSIRIIITHAESHWWVLRKAEELYG